MRRITEETGRSYPPTPSKRTSTQSRHINAGPFGLSITNSYSLTPFCEIMIYPNSTYVLSKTATTTWEVIDGQQRLRAIWDFFATRFRLTLIQSMAKQ